VHHYAGAVEYTVTGFIEKNRDDLPRETAELLLKSTKSFVRLLAGNISNATGQSVVGMEPEDGVPKGVRPTVGSHFREQVWDLRSKIDGTAPHYVRCIKPNSSLSPGSYDECLVAHQLRCGGVLQAVSVTRSGFTLHYTHDDFVKRYGILAKGIRGKPSTTRRPRDTQTCEALVDTLLDSLETQLDSTARTAKPPKEAEKLIQFGKSKVLLKHGAFECLERLVGKVQIQAATVINAWIRRFLCKVAFTSVRLSFRHELELMGTTFEAWFRESREIYYRKRDKSARSVPNIVKQRRIMFLRTASGGAETQGSAAKMRITGVVPRNPAWIVTDGLWTRNPGYTS
jgi:myosin V